MKTNSTIYTLTAAAAALLALTSCNDFLDKMPDNRAELDTKEKVRALLVSAYPENDYMLVTEFMSDNVDDYGPNNPYTDRFIDQVYAWADVTERDNESPENIWDANYNAIASANHAIQAIENMAEKIEGYEAPSGSMLDRAVAAAQATGMQAELAEALLCRAYCHFMLVNIFALNYNTATSANDLGITYCYAPETTLNPKSERQSVKEIYESIDADLQAALPNVGDSYYTVPKYHFNQKAAYAFASRFYLFYEQWAEAIKYADLCLGSSPGNTLRDWSVQAGMAQDKDAITNHYIDASVNANLLLMTAYSKMGLAFENYYTYSKYSHGAYLANNEDGIALTKLWGGSNSTYYMPMKIYSATNMNRVIFWKLPYLFEYTDPVAGIGYYRTVYPALTTDEVLLNRAEAEIMMEQYDQALEDINLWVRNIARNPQTLTEEKIRSYFDAMDYCVWDKSTPKKELHPAFSISERQEPFLQCVLNLKRVETLGNGLRWFDIKRYGIEIERRVMNMAGNPSSKTDQLMKDDLRRAVQVPKKVIDAGYEKNPR